MLGHVTHKYPFVFYPSIFLYRIYGHTYNATAFIVVASDSTPFSLLLERLGVELVLSRATNFKNLVIGKREKVERILLL